MYSNPSNDLISSSDSFMAANLFSISFHSQRKSTKKGERKRRKLEQENKRKKDISEDGSILGSTLVHCPDAPGFVELEVVSQTLQC